MFLKKFNLITSLLVAILMISVSANVLAFQFTPSQSTPKVFNENTDELDQDVPEQIEAQPTNLGQDAEISEPVTTTKTLTKNLPLERVSASEVLEKLPYLANPGDYNPTKYLEGQAFEPYTLNVDDNTGETIIPPEQLLRLTSAGEAGALSTRSRSRADAGDDSSEATDLYDGGNWTGDWVSTEIDPNPQPHYVFNDWDWFKIWVREKGGMKADYVTLRIENTAPASTTVTRDLHCYMFEPLSIILNVSATYPFYGDHQDTPLSKSDGEVTQKYIDAEIVPPGENRTLNAAPPITSYFYIWILGLSDIDINYNITSIEVTEISRDNNNYPENATIPQNEAATNQQVEQHRDHWDWYDISGSFNYTGSKWDNKITFTVDIKTEERGPGNDDHSWTEVFVIYDDDPGNTLYIHGSERTTGGSPSRAGTDPIKHSFITSGKLALMGIRTWGMHVSSSSGNYLQTTFNGKVTYDLSYDIKIQNIDPQLDQGKRAPDQEFYYLEDKITFQVRYRDLDNDEPDYVHVTIDGENYDMTSTQTNYVTGATYTQTVDCSDLGLTPYPHQFNYSATDGQVPISMELPDPKNKFYIIENQTPNIFTSAPSVVAMKEDDEVKLIPMNQIFEDVDITDGMDFHIWYSSSWGKKFESDLMEVFFSENNNNLKIQLKANQHGYNSVTLRARETLIRGTDTYTFYSTHKLNITVEPVNDAPLLEPVTNVQGYQDHVINVQLLATDPDILTDDDELTFSTNRTDGMGPDDIEGFVLTHDPKYTYKANITFTPTNEHVGKFFVKVTVSDHDNDEDSQEVEFEILNVNDPPEIVEITTSKETKIIEPETTQVDFEGKRYGAREDEWFNMTVKIVDLDIAIGIDNEIEFNLENSSFSSAININPSSASPLIAEVGFLPRDYDVGTNYINLSVHDGKGGSDYIVIEIETLNVNDPPNIPEILKPEGENNTFSIVEDIDFQGQCDDEDFYISDSEELLNYFWKLEYMDGSDKVEELNRGTADSYEPFSFMMRPLDRHLQMDEYTIRLLVRDTEKEEASVTIKISISEDFDGDEMPDQWEYQYGLDYTDRKDAIEDKDSDGASNLEEYKAGTNPYDPTSKPKSEEVAVDYTLAIVVVIVVIIIIVLLVVFMLIKKKRAAKADSEDLSRLAYPVEEDFEMELAKPMGGGPQPGMPGAGGAGGPPGMPMTMTPQQFMAMDPMQRMQMMQQMQMMMMQQQQLQGKQGKQGPGKGSTGGTGAGAGAGTSGVGAGELKATTEKIDKATLVESGKESQLDTVSLKPQLPPGKVTQPDSDQEQEQDVTAPEPAPGGRHSPIDSVSEDELGGFDLSEIDETGAGPALVAGAPGFMSESEIADAGITEAQGEYGSGDIDLEAKLEPDDIEAEEEEMKCPNCGTPVKSGWFLCPDCKSPIN
ncbi:hypothetical protein [[Eubacterium] cellulosolvens]